MASKRPDTPNRETESTGGALRWLGIGGGIALALAALAVVLAWQHATRDRYAAEDVKARVAAEMNRIEAEANRIERNAAQ